MRVSGKFFAATAIAVTVLFAAAPASAACKVLGFTVNDYGKVGPTADAKRLLDGYIAKWATQHKIKKYRAGKKSVSCYKFLDFGFFDEWTCKATSNVCFSGKLPKGVTATPKKDLAKQKADAKAQAKAAKKAKKKG